MLAESNAAVQEQYDKETSLRLVRDAGSLCSHKVIALRSSAGNLLFEVGKEKHCNLLMLAEGNVAVYAPFEKAAFLRLVGVKGSLCSHKVIALRSCAGNLLFEVGKEF